MAMFPANPTRIDPFKNFLFRIKWDNQYVAAVSKISSLKRTTEVIPFRSGGDALTQTLSPGKVKYESITCERGLTMDMAFHDWAGLVFNYGAGFGAMVSLASFRKNLYIEFYNEAGQLAMAYQLFRCWVSEYHALPDLDAGGNAIAIEYLKIETEGWMRDPSVSEPVEPTLSTVST
jgi:phage tail-like protein